MSTKQETETEVSLVLSLLRARPTFLGLCQLARPLSNHGAPWWNQIQENWAWGMYLWVQGPSVIPRRFLSGPMSIGCVGTSILPMSESTGIFAYYSHLLIPQLQTEHLDCCMVLSTPLLIPFTKLDKQAPNQKTVLVSWWAQGCIRQPLKASTMD